MDFGFCHKFWNQVEKLSDAFALFLIQRIMIKNTKNSKKIK